jgi:hypothetical protein
MLPVDSQPGQIHPWRASCKQHDPLKEFEVKNEKRVKWSFNFRLTRYPIISSQDLMGRAARLSQSPRSVACITGIMGQLEAGAVNMFPNTDRRQIQPQESAWRDQVDSSE